MRKDHLTIKSGKGAEKRIVQATNLNDHVFEVAVDQVEYERRSPIMENISIILPEKLSIKLREKAEEADILPEELITELIFKSLDEELDPEELVEHYSALSEKYFAEAKEFLSKGDLVQTSEKLWGAASSAVKMVAAKRGLKLSKHGSLWTFIDTVAGETGDEDFTRFFHVANSLHRNFYENEMKAKTLETAARDIERLISKLRDLTKS